MSAVIRAMVVAIALFWTVVSPVSAQVTEAQTTANASGLTREEAVQSALVQAAGQAFGIQLQAFTQVEAVSAEASVNNQDESLYLSSINKQVQQQINSPSNSPILGYSVDHAVAMPTGGWEATVTLRYAQYNQVGAPSERRTAVVVAQDKRYRDMLLAQVEQALVASRRFDVLSRDKQAAFDREIAFVESDNASQLEVARLGRAAGADYLVVVQFQNLGIANNQRETIRMTGEVLVKSSVSGVLKLDVIEFSSRKVKWSGTEKFGATFQGASSVGSGTLANLVSRAADTLIDRMVAGIYPIRVVKVMGSSMAILNRGEGSIKKGEKYAVFMMGEDLMDPQSGESLGPLEVDAGIGTIVDVKPKFSTLKMDSGTLESDLNYVVRKTSGAAAPARPASRSSRNNAANAKPAEPSRKNVFLN